MSDAARIRIAAGVTALFIAALSAIGLATHRGTPPGAPAAPVVSAAAQPAPTRAAAVTTYADDDHEDEYEDDD